MTVQNPLEKKNNSFRSSVSHATELGCESFVLTCIYTQLVMLFCSLYLPIHPHIHLSIHPSTHQPAIPLTRVGKKLILERYLKENPFLGRRRAKSWEGLGLKILLLGGLGRTVQTLAVGVCFWGRSPAGGSSRYWKHTKTLPPLHDARQSPALARFLSHLLLLPHPLGLQASAHNYPNEALPLPSCRSGQRRAQPLAWSELQEEEEAGQGCLCHSAPLTPRRSIGVGDVRPDAQR